MGCDCEREESVEGVMWWKNEIEGYCNGVLGADVERRFWGQNRTGDLHRIRRSGLDLGGVFGNRPL